MLKKARAHTQRRIVVEFLILVSSLRKVQYTFHIRRNMYRCTNHNILYSNDYYLFMASK